MRVTSWLFCLNQWVLFLGESGSAWSGVATVWGRSQGSAQLEPCRRHWPLPQALAGTRHLPQRPGLSPACAGLGRGARPGSYPLRRGPSGSC